MQDAGGTSDWTAPPGPAASTHVTGPPGAMFDGCETVSKSRTFTPWPVSGLNVDVVPRYTWKWIVSCGGMLLPGEEAPVPLHWKWVVAFVLGAVQVRVISLFCCV